MAEGNSAHGDCQANHAALQGGFLRCSLLFISGFMMLNISGLQQSEMRRELQETMTQVQEFLQTNTELSDESLRELLGINMLRSAFTAAKQMKPTTILWERCRRFCFVPKGSLRAGKSRRTARTSRL